MNEKQLSVNDVSEIIKDGMRPTARTKYKLPHVTVDCSDLDLAVGPHEIRGQWSALHAAEAVAAMGRTKISRPLDYVYWEKDGRVIGCDGAALVALASPDKPSQTESVLVLAHKSIIGFRKKFLAATILEGTHQHTSYAAVIVPPPNFDQVIPKFNLGLGRHMHRDMSIYDLRRLYWFTYALSSLARRIGERIAVAFPERRDILEPGVAPPHECYRDNFNDYAFDATKLNRLLKSLIYGSRRQFGDELGRDLLGLVYSPNGRSARADVPTLVLSSEAVKCSGERHTGVLMAIRSPKENPTGFTVVMPRDLFVL